MTDGAGSNGSRDDDAGTTRANRAGESPSDEADLRQLAQDWISLWQSELAAIAVDREAQENWQALLRLWAGAASAMLAAMPRSEAGFAAPPPHERPSRPAEAEPAPRAAPAPAASDPRDAEIERLARHVAQLEARLAGLERGHRGGTERMPRKRKR